MNIIVFCNSTILTIFATYMCQNKRYFVVHTNTKMIVCVQLNYTIGKLADKLKLDMTVFREHKPSSGRVV